MKKYNNFKSNKILLVVMSTLILAIISVSIFSEAQMENKYKLNDMQNSFFNIVSYMEKNDDILVEKMRDFNKNLKFEKTEQLG
ncbi:MAG: hypothetical protein ACRDD7_06950, partial [Peptostreptococcaceae bacterium]